MAWLARGVWQDIGAGEHDEGEATKALGDLDADPTGVLVLTEPKMAFTLEVVVMPYEVVGGLHQGGAEAAVGAAPQRAALIDLIALIAAGSQAGAAGDAVGRGIMRDGSEFP